MVHYFSCAYTPQQNSVVERKHQHLLNVAKALLFQSNVPLVYWSDCVTAAAFLINKYDSFEKLLHKTPDYSQLKSFGCLVYVSTLEKDRSKFSPRARSCVFLGYPSGYKGYKVLNLDTNTISISRHVIFHETVFPFKTTTQLDHHFFSNTILPLPAPYVLDSPLLPSFSAASSSSSLPSTNASLVLPNHVTTSAASPHVLPAISPDASTSSLPTAAFLSPRFVSHPDHASSSLPTGSTLSSVPVVPTDSVPRANVPLLPDSSEIYVPIVRPKRQTKAPSYLFEYHCVLAQLTPPLPPSHTNFYPLSSVLSYNRFTPHYCVSLLSYSIATEPKTFKQAIAHEKWKGALGEKLHAMEQTELGVFALRH